MRLAQSIADGAKGSAVTHKFETGIENTKKLDIDHRAQSRWYRAAIYAILLLSAAVYLPSIDGLALWDDRALIGAYRSLGQCVETPFLQHYFRPLVSITFFLEWRVWGRDAFFCHQDNLLIHVATTGALVGLLRALFVNRWVAALGGLLFAVQPAQVCTVAWIGGRTDSLCTLWLTLFLWTLMLSARARGGRGCLWTALSVLLFELALLTKEQALAVLPLAPTVYLWLGANQEPRRMETSGSAVGAAAVRSLPLLAAGIVFVALWLLHYPDPRAPQRVPAVDQALLAGHAAAYYGLLFLAPAPRWLHTLTLAHLENLGWWPAAAGYTLLAALVFLLVRWRKTSPSSAILLLYALLAYVPVSNLVPMPSLYAAPYRVGILGPAIAALMAAGIFRIAALRPRAAPWFGTVATVCATGAFTIWCASLTLADNAYWTSQQTLFGVFHRDDPGNIPTTCQYSRELVAANRSPEAVAILEKMLDGLFGNRAWVEPQSAAVELRINPDLQRKLRLQYGSSDPISRRLGGVLGDLANARWGAGNRQGAGAALRSAFAIDRANPYVNLIAARIAYARRDYRSALAAMRISLAGQSERYESHAMMLETLLALKYLREAETECEACIELEPWRAAAYRQLASVRCALGDHTGAEQALHQALRDSEGDHIEERRALAEMRRLVAAGATVNPR